MVPLREGLRSGDLLPKNAARMVLNAMEKGFTVKAFSLAQQVDLAKGEGGHGHEVSSGEELLGTVGEALVSVLTISFALCAVAADDQQTPIGSFPEVKARELIPSAPAAV
jgi:hypothetical protein